MELYQIIAIFRLHIKLFFGIMTSFFLCGFIFFISQPERYSVNLMINVTRANVQETTEYRYDDFYRLQADERFADTVVRWMGSPQIIKEICADAGMFSEKSFKASRLSSQMVEVVFILDKKEDALKIAESTLKILNNQTNRLNELQRQDSWFALISNEPYVQDARLGWRLVLLATVFLGLFFGIWGVMMMDYLRRK